MVTRDIPDYALVVGNPAKQKGWMSRHGHPLKEPDGDGVMTCPESRLRYKVVDENKVRYVDVDENEPLPEIHSSRNVTYHSIRNER